MKSVTAVILFFFSLSAIAGPKAYELKIDFSMHGKHVSSPRIIVKEGESATITQESNGEKIFMDVIVTGKKKAITMKFELSTLTAAGEKKIFSAPKIIALENEKAQISVGNENDKDLLDMSVVANRTTL